MSQKKSNRRVSFAFVLTFGILGLVQLAFCLHSLTVASQLSEKAGRFPLGDARVLLQR